MDVILAPVSTPKPLVALLAGEIAKAVHHPDIAYYAKAVKLSGAKID
jgi:hypothetical protein